MALEIKYKMLPHWHMLFGAIFSLLLWPVFGSGSLVIFAASVLVDVDHYPRYRKYMIAKNDYSLMRACRFFKKRAEEKSKRKYLCVFHTIEFWLLLLAASFYSMFIFLIFTGVMLHMLLDISSYRKRSFSLIAFLRQKQLTKQNI